MDTAVSGSAGGWAWRTAGGGGVGLLSGLERWRIGNWLLDCATGLDNANHAGVVAVIAAILCAVLCERVLRVSAVFLGGGIIYETFQIYDTC